MPAECIVKLLDDIRLVDPERFQLAQTVRNITLGLDASITEEVKYGGILFSAGHDLAVRLKYT